MLIIVVRMEMIKKTLKEKEAFHQLKIIHRPFLSVNKFLQVKLHLKINKMILIWKILLSKVN